MAHHVFNLQVRTSFVYGSSMMNLVSFLTFIVAWYLMLYKQAPTFVFMPFFAAVLYDIFLYKPMQRDWDMGGTDKIVIDSHAREIIFDNNVRIPFDNIERVRVEIEERPRMCWFLALGSQYNKLVNGEIFFKLNDDTTTTASIQFKDDVYRLIDVVHKQGIPARIQGENLMEEKIPNGIWCFLIFLLIGGYLLILANQFFNNL